MEREAPPLFVGRFDTREHAEEAHRALVEKGFGATAQRVDDADHRPDDPAILRRGGVRDLIENMLRTRVDARPEWLVVAHGVPATRHDEVREVLGQRGRVETVAHADAGSSVDGEVALFGPDIASLPGSPSGWAHDRLPR
jgi:hypothetical protein